MPRARVDARSGAGARVRRRACSTRGDEPARRPALAPRRGGARRGAAERRRGVRPRRSRPSGSCAGALRGDLDAALLRRARLLERAGGVDERAAERDELRALALTKLGIAELWTGDLDARGATSSGPRGAADGRGRDWLALLAHGAPRGRTACSAASSSARCASPTQAVALAAARGWCAHVAGGVAAGVARARSPSSATGSTRRERSCAAPTSCSRDPRDARCARWHAAPPRAAAERRAGEPEPRARGAPRRAREAAATGRSSPPLRGLHRGLEALAARRAWASRRARRALLERVDGEPDGGRRRRAGPAAPAGRRPGGARDARRSRSSSDGAPRASARRGPRRGCSTRWRRRARRRTRPAAALARARARPRRAGGIRRPFLEHGGADRARCCTATLRHGTAPPRAASSDAAARRSSARGGTAGAAARCSSSRCREREAAVLRFLPTMMSNQEIAVGAVRVGQHGQDAPEGDLPQARRRRTAASAVRRARELELLAP